MMSNKTYNILKILALIVLPALGTLYASLAEIWGLPYGSQISASILAIDTFLGALVEISKVQYTRALRKKELENVSISDNAGCGE